MYLFLCMLETLYLHRKHISGCCAKTTRQNSRRLVEEFTESIASTLDSPVLFFFFEKILLRDVIYLRSSSRTRVNSYKYPKRAAKACGKERPEVERENNIGKSDVKLLKRLKLFLASGVEADGRLREESIPSLTIGRSHNPAWFNANRNV